MKYLRILLAVFLPLSAAAKVAVTAPQTEHLTYPLGLDTDRPRFSWKIESDGRHVLAYNNFATQPGPRKGPRTPLGLAISYDGMRWRHFLTLEDSPVSQYPYPAVIQGRDGSLHCVYTWRRQRVAYKKIDVEALKKGERGIDFH